MTGDPKAPGAPAIFLYRQVDRSDLNNIEYDYLRIKVLTEEGRKRGDVELLYLPSEYNIKSIKARTIHSDGKIITFDGKIYDKTVVKAGDLKYSAKTFTLPDVQVGSIIEYRYTVEENPNLLFDSHWVLNEDLFTRHAKFSVRLYEGFAARWHGHRLPPGVVLPKAASDRTVRLEIADIPAYTEEEYSPPEEEVRSVVDFIYSRNEESDKAKYWKTEDKNLHEQVEQFVGKHKEIADAAAQIAPAGDPPEVRLQKLYAKVQSLRNFTYEVEKTEQEEKREKRKDNENVMDVWKRGGGDSLDLNWLFLGLARGAGFQASAVFVSPRSRHFFNSDNLNSRLLSYRIVQVKLDGKDLYLDPGCAFLPFGTLDWPETTVNGLRVDKDAGTWIQTPIAPSSESRLVRKAALKLDAQGNISGKVTVTYTGLVCLRRRQAEMHEDDAHRKTYLEQNVQTWIPVGSDVDLASKPDWSSSSREMVAEFDVKIPGWASAAGRKALMPVGVFGNAEKHMFEHAERTSQIYFSFPYQLADDVTIQLPPGWKVTTVPNAEKQDLGAFAFESSVENKNDAVHLTRSISVNNVYLDVKNYPTIRAFYQYVKSSDEQQIIVQPGAPGGQN